MARKRRHKNRRHTRRAARLANPRRHRKHHNRKRRGMFRLFNKRRHRNPDISGLTQALLAGAAGYIAAKGFGMFADRYLPPSVPYRSFVGTGLSAVAAVALAETFLKNKPKVSAAVSVGAVMPLAEEFIKMTPLGPMIGLYRDGYDAPSGGASLPAPGGVDEDLAASLGAGLSGQLRSGGGREYDARGSGYWAAYQ